MERTTLGIDVGASYVKIVSLTQEGDGTATQAYLPHKGEPIGALLSHLHVLPADAFHVGITGSGSGLLGSRFAVDPVHSIQAEIQSVTRRFDGVRNIINIGAGSSTIIHLDDGGRFLSYNTNSLCAAGTGSFLDEQAQRLGIDYENLSAIAFDEDPPSIASRCAVFAKSDLIHRQQEGYTKEQMWAGLCKGCVDTFLQTLLRGEPLSGLTVVTGGVTKNPLIMRWLTHYYGEQIRTWENAHLSGAIGAAELADGEPWEPARFRESLAPRVAETFTPVDRGAPLELVRSTYPSFDVHEEALDDDGNEIRLWRDLEPGELPVWLGVDIGSTSTKLVLLDAGRRVVLDIYRKTLGDPLGAVRKLFTAIETLSAARGVTFSVLGSGTTGSGRKFIGKIIGADQVVNEISAHVAGAMETDPEIDTIFEIGGQDSKYMRTVGGHIRDANMNFICAAGTGSFVEEQAGKMGVPVSDVGSMVMGVRPPQTSDRCTVFMEEDVRKLSRQGFSKTEALAGVLNSVVKNYLNKVVGNRHVSDRKVFFQGATARNKGLVAAFEQNLGVEVVVSPLCHQMGSYGVALIVSEQQGDRESTFRGFGLSRRKIELRREPCELCNNRCTITHAGIEGTDEEPSWGYMCGKEPDAAKRKKNTAFRLFRTRDRLLKEAMKNQTVPADARTVGLSASLTAYSLLPFWTGLFNALGMKVRLSGETDDAVKEAGIQNASGDFCFPIKIALGHALLAAEKSKDDFILLPYAISAQPNPHTSNSLYCPYVQSIPSVARSAMTMKGMSADRMLTPVLDFRWDEKRLVKELVESIGDRVGADRKTVRKALAHARTEQERFEMGCHAEGGKALAEMSARNEKAIVVVGRPYNCFDPGANIGLPEKISEYGYTVVPIDFLPYDPADLGDRWQNIYWNYGQRIVAAAKTAAESANLFTVYLTNFSCGPDSFLLTYAEQIMGEKPLLILELDEHGADAGYITRVEAFLDVVDSYSEKPVARPYVAKPMDVDELKKRTLWIPPMHPHVATIAAGLFEKYGYKAKALPPEDRDAYEIGRKATRGSECLPTSVTIGGLLKTLRAIDADPSEHAFFMATASGPCRFGQYATLHRKVLDENGFGDVRILSPSSFNSYQGLPEKLRRELWWAFLAADVLQKMECKVRPYEKNPGQTDALVADWVHRLTRTFAEARKLESAVREMADSFSGVPRTDGTRPLVGVVGEIYVRCNPFSNGYVIEEIEKYGGEAWLTPLSEWFLYTAHIQKWTASQKLRGITARGMSLLKNRFLQKAEHAVYGWAGPILTDRHEPAIEGVVERGRRYLPVNFEGEAILTLGRAIEFAEGGASLIVNCAPFGCMPGTLTSAIFNEIQAETGVPMVSMYYDGHGEINRQLEVYIREAAGRTKTAV